MRILFIIVLALCLFGCDPGSPEMIKSLSLPTEAKNIKSIGGYWYTFELKIEDKDHLFLHRHGSTNLTEISR